jgi:CheY-like chemotaxis protein
MFAANRILVVDDDRDVLRGARLRLECAGYETFSAADGEEGVAAAVKLSPDAILLDVRMPRMDGLTALAKLRERAETRNIPVVMLSASLIDQQAALDAGARFFLSKPYQGRTLLAAIESATNNEIIRN